MTTKIVDFTNPESVKQPVEPIEDYPDTITTLGLKTDFKQEMVSYIYVYLGIYLYLGDIIRNLRDIDIGIMHLREICIYKYIYIYIYIYRCMLFL